MAEPIEAIALRATDTMVLMAWWDAPSPDVREWFNIRSCSFDAGGAGAIRTIRLTRDEAMKLVQAIQNG